MSQQTTTRETSGRAATQATASAGSRALQIGLAALLGTFLIAGTGLAHVDAVHNAAHDTRHSLAFPCH